VRCRRGVGECGGRWGGREKEKSMTCGSQTVRDIEVDRCWKIGTELEILDDQVGIFLLEVQFGGWQVRTILVEN
jgi:hypothetical protein